MRDVKPRTVLLGTSRTATGIDPLHPGFAPGDAPVLNLSLGASSIEQIRLLLVHANSTSPVRMAVIGLDMESFLDAGRPDFDPAALNGNPETEPERLVRLRIDVSREALSASLARWIGPAASEPGSGTLELADPQARGVSDAMLQEFDGQRGIIWASEFGNFYSRFRISFRKGTAGHDGTPTGDARPRWHHSGVARLRSPRRYRAPDVHLSCSRPLPRVVPAGGLVAPIRGLEARAGRRHRYRSRASRRPAFALWDFSGFHALAMESVPRLGDWSTRMRWYRDTSHYSPELGNLILDRVLGRPGSGGSLPDARISGATIDRHLAGIRMGAMEYRLSQPGEVANVSEMLTLPSACGGK